MKEIIVRPIRPKQKKVIRFECECGCVFETDEHRQTPMIAQQKGEGTYISECPCCGKEVWE